MANGSTDVREAETEATRAREGLGDLVAELGRRRHTGLDLKGRAREHKALLITGAALASAAAVGFVVAAVVRRRRSHTTGYKLHQLREAGRRIIAHPERVAADDPSGMRRLATSVLTTVVMSYARKYLTARPRHA